MGILIRVEFVIDANRKLLLDPTDDEESFASSTISIITDHQGDLCGMNKLGGSGVDKQVLLECISLAKSRKQRFLEILS